MTKRVRNSVCYIESCSIEVKLKIIEDLCSKDLANLECVDSEWQQLLNNNDWWWKNKCFSDDLWLKMWKNNVYSFCVRAQLIHNKDTGIHVDYYDEKVWDQFCNQIKDAANNFNLVENLPEGWTWKELYNLWNIVEKHEEAYLEFPDRRRIHGEGFASFVSYLHTSNAIRIIRQKSRLVAWNDIKYPLYAFDDSFKTLLNVEPNYERQWDKFCDEVLASISEESIY